MRKGRKKIAILGPVGNAIPPKKQGAIEWMVYYLTEGLIKRGYEVLLFGPKISRTSAKLVPVGPKPMVEYRVLPDYERARKMRIELSMLANMFYEVRKRKKEIGIIFNHTVSGGMFASWEKIFNLPVFHTLHLPLFKELADVFEKYNAQLISISDSQRKPFPHLNYAATIYNGIDLRRFSFSREIKDYFIFSSKILAAKNPLDAIRATKLAHEKIVILGRINDPEYFETKIRPLLGKNVIYLGEVSLSRAKEFYKNAKALLFPIKCRESFGLVMIEAMACGTPVIAYPKGAIREVIKDKKTGFIVKNTKEMVEAIKKIDQIDRRECRKLVEEKFTIEKMVDNYEKVYQKILKERKIK